MPYTLGLDLGVASLGYTIVEGENIINTGVRIFSAGKQELGKGEKEISLTQKRTEARQKRRQFTRKSRKMNHLRQILQTNGLLPDTIDDKFLTSINPYEARSNGVNNKIELFEIGRAFYNIAKRRGYKNISQSRSDDTEKGTIFKGKDKPGINELKELVDGVRYKTIGEYFWFLIQTEQTEIKRVRNRYTERSMYIQEFDLIWEKQRNFYPNLLTIDLRDLVRDKIIFFQRPLQSQKKLIGKCQFTGKRRIAKSDPLFQEFRLHQQINNLRIVGGNRFDDESQRLTSEEVIKLEEYLHNNSKLELNPNNNYKKFKNILKVLYYE